MTKSNQTHPWKLLGKTVKLSYRGNPMDSSPVLLTGEVTGVHLTTRPNVDEFAVVLSLGRLEADLCEWTVEDSNIADTFADMFVDVEYADDDDIEIAVARYLEYAEITADELKAEAKTGRFRSEKARAAWFSISPYIEDEVPYSSQKPVCESCEELRFENKRLIDRIAKAKEYTDELNKYSGRLFNALEETREQLRRAEDADHRKKDS